MTPKISSQISFNIVPNLPKELEALREIAYNLWWTWQPDARRLFRHLDKELWYKVNHSPVRMLQLTRQARFEELAKDDDFLRELNKVQTALRSYMSRKDTYAAKRGTSPSIAYFSAEFGFHESIPIYSGGLGILSGDHCKSASDLALNFVAVTLFYRHGYFRQEITRDGSQHAVELDQNFHQLPVQEVQKDGAPLVIRVPILQREVCAKVWKMQIGRIALYLLDTDVAENTPEDRMITHQLYGGDNEMRIKQEIILGIGGVRMLQALGIEPETWHMNEGHSAFSSLERIRNLIKNKELDFRTALQLAAASSVFTTHTPVPAGNDAFPRPLMEKYFADMPHHLGISMDEFVSFGQERTNDPNEPFSMTILALRSSRFANGVSKLHGSVSRDMWKNVWSGVPTEEVPITSITNGIHTRTWLAPEFASLYEQYLGEDWEDHLTDRDFWRRTYDIPAEKLWETHQRLKERLVNFARRRIQRQRKRNGEAPEHIRSVLQKLNPEILTVGFARRFATYKRATLLFSDPDRLHALLNHPERPVQFIFAGKAHPADKHGQEFIRKVVEFARKSDFQERIAFIEDYDAYIGRRLYQGVDIWLNNPMRPLEASGTSGMKLPPNGGLNLSVLDGWWLESYNQKNGWAIGAELDGHDFIGTDAGDKDLLKLQNDVDADSLYKLLEQQVAPLYYAKPDGHLPSAWIQLMRESMRSVTPEFNTHRMVAEYNERLYENAARSAKMLLENDCKNAKSLSVWKEQIRHQWGQLHFVRTEVPVENLSSIPVGSKVPVVAELHTGSVDPANITVQAYYGESEDDQTIQDARIETLRMKKHDSTRGTALYEGEIPASDSGAYGVTFRILPHSPNLVQNHELRLITWSHSVA